MTGQHAREPSLLEQASGRNGIPHPQTSRAKSLPEVDARDKPPAGEGVRATPAGGPCTPRSDCKGWELAHMLAAQLGCHVYGGCPGGETTDHADDTTALRKYSAAVQEAG